MSTPLPFQGKGLDRKLGGMRNVWGKAKSNLLGCS